MLTHMKLKIGVMGSAGGECTAHGRSLAFALGQAIGQADCYMVTGGCPGLPLEAARGTKAVGGLVIGISPGLSLDEHIHKYDSPIEAHDLLIFTGSGLMGREVVNIRSSDIVIIIGGSSGTFGELAIAYDEGKLIGILQGSGGISETAADILAACKKETGARVLYESDPNRLVTKLLDVYRTVHHVKPSCFCEDRANCPCCLHLHPPTTAADEKGENGHGFTDQRSRGEGL